jgi:hypothetical protein
MTIYPTTSGRWQVSYRSRGSDGWSIHIADELEDAIADALGKDIDMARAPRKSTKKSPNDVALKLQDAMKFLSVAHKAGGNTQAQHTFFTGDGWACAFDGIIAAAIPIEGIDFKAYVNTALMTDALKHVGTAMELTVTAEGVNIVSGDYQVTVANNPATDQLIPTPPDPQLAPLDARFKVGMELAGRIVSDTATTVRDASIYFQPVAPGEAVSYTVIATNGKVVVQAKITDGAMPAGLLLPKAFVNAIVKSGVEVVGWGFSEQTFTAHMATGGFIRTQRYLDEYDMRVVKAVDRLLNAPTVAPPPKGFFEAVEAVAPFGDGTVFFIAGNVCAGPDDDNEKWAAVQAVDKLPDGVGTIAKALLTYKDETTGIWLGDELNTDGGGHRVVLTGEMFRASILGVPVSESNQSAVVHQPSSVAAAAPVWSPPADWNANALQPPPDGWGETDDIPF